MVVFFILVGFNRDGVIISFFFLSPTIPDQRLFQLGVVVVVAKCIYQEVCVVVVVSPQG